MRKKAEEELESFKAVLKAHCGSLAFGLRMS